MRRVEELDIWGAKRESRNMGVGVERKNERQNLNRK